MSHLHLSLYVGIHHKTQMGDCKDTKSATCTHPVDTFIFCGCKKQYNMDIDRYEALHCLQNLSKGKDCSRIWGRKYSSHGHYSRKWYVIYGLVCYNFRERTKLELCRLNFYKSHIPCSSISSSEFEGSKCHLYICHRHLESTTKPKWDIARI